MSSQQVIKKEMSSRLKEIREIYKDLMSSIGKNSFRNKERQGLSYEQAVQRKNLTKTAISPYMHYIVKIARRIMPSFSNDIRI